MNSQLKLTFIIRRMVLSTMSVMIKYSNGVDTTTRQILYLRLSISFGMYRSNGLAWMAKSMQAFCSKRQHNKNIPAHCVDGHVYWLFSCLILINFTVLQFGFALLLKGDDDQSHEDVDEEEREDDKVDYVENKHLDAEEGNRSLVLVRHCHGVLKYAAGER